MKKIYYLIFLTFTVFGASAQSYHDDIQALINNVELDTLIKHVRILSGEDSVFIDGQKELIVDRIYDSNDLAADYLTKTLEMYGLPTWKDVYGLYGTNVYAVQEGSEFPDKYYMICAHYDAVTTFCADDNASGTAAVLEAARLFSNHDFKYSIIYALWDEEEIGLYGSWNYAQQAASNNDDIISVINLDMIAWDSNDDGLCELHVRNYANSISLANYMVEVNDIYNIGLNPTIINPGTEASDHTSFWYNNYSALLLIEAYYGGDMNPYYHTSLDRVSIFNFPYFHNMSKYSIGSLASLAEPSIYTSVNDLKVSDGIKLSNFPNPFNHSTNLIINSKHETSASVSVINSSGQVVFELNYHKLETGTNQIDFVRNNMTSGIYYVIVITPNDYSTLKMLIH